MGRDSAISWCHHTFNGWWGCEKVSPACKQCYAEAFAKRTGNKVWGRSSSRRFFGEKHWREPLKWEHRAEEEGVRYRVFSGSMCDVFEDRRDLDPWRWKLWNLIWHTPMLDWLLLTKRPENIRGMIPTEWLEAPRHNVWFGTTVENQEWADRRIPELLKVPAAVRFLSVEPMLGPVRLLGHLMEGEDPGKCARCGQGHGFTRCPNYGGVASTAARHRPGTNCPQFERKNFALHWVIVGGESGGNARVMEPDWARDVRDQCRRAAVAFHFKQKGAALSRRMKCKDRAGADAAEWPEDLRVQEFPSAAIAGGI